MTVDAYYKKVVEKIESKQFKVFEISTPAPEKISPHIEALNFIIWEWGDDNKDPRDLNWEYVIIPNDCDFDFTSIDFDIFFEFLRKTKTDESTLVETKEIEVIREHQQQIESTKVTENIWTDDDFWDS